MDPITGVSIIDWFLSLLDSWGYVLVTLFTISENVFIIGSFTPGETMVIAAAFVTTADPGTLWLPLVWLCSVVGTMIGSNVSFAFGRRGGRDALMKYGHRFHINDERIAEAEAYFDLHGSKTIFFSRFATGLKNFVPVIAGVSKMPPLHFQGWTLLSAVTYTSIMCAIGVLVGENFERALAIARGFGVFGFVLFLGIIVLVLIGRRRYYAHRREEILEEYLHAHADDHAHADAHADDHAGDHAGARGGADPEDTRP